MVFMWKGVFEVERWKGEMVERFPRNKPQQALSVSSRASLLDPGSSLLKTNSQPRNKPRQTTHRVIPAYRGPRRIGNDPVGWFEPGSSLLGLFGIQTGLETGISMKPILPV